MDTAAVRFSALGPLRAERGCEVLDLGPVRQQALLAALLCHPNKPLTPEALLEAVWGERPPPSGAKVIPTYVYRLRRLLGGPGTHGTLIEGVRGGYRLRLDPDQLDVFAFERLVRDGQEARLAGYGDRASRLLNEALALWNGEPFAGLPGPLLTAQRRRLGEHRMVALEHRLELDLASGAPEAVVPELRLLWADHPGRERFAALLMTALYQGGRQAEALDVYTRTRGTLVEELGVEPGPELRSVHQAVLRGQDDVLGTAVPPSAPTAEIGCGLPRDVPELAGREHELGVLVESLGTSERPAATRVCAVDGMPGVGKTALALRAAHALVDRYPDGQIFLDLHGHAVDREPTEPGEALGHLLRSLGVGDDRIPADPDDRATRWRAELTGRRVLVVLDDAAGTEQLARLLPGDPGCAVLVTSRRRLTGLQPTGLVSLGPLAPRPARSMLVRLLPDRPAGDCPALDELLQSCGGLPLAVRYAAARLSHRPLWPAAELARRLDRHHAAPLTELRTEQATLADAFDASYLRLTATDRETFLVLGQLSAEGFGLADVTRAARTVPWDAVESLERLLDVNLVEQTGADRYRLHPLLRAFAAARSGRAPAAVSTVGRATAV